MKFISRLYHFVGGINFTLILIAAVALFVIAGTFIESSTQSHRFAAQFTYSNPIFGLLLWGFFANILFSATRRWPFQMRHLPFLITHFGLLMILGGVLAKHYFGLQGTMTITEGSASQEFFENDTYAIHLEKRKSPPERYVLKSNFFGNFETLIADREDGLRLQLVQYAPHSSERLTTWIKGDFVTISGLKPMPLQEIIDLKTSPPQISGKVRFFDEAPPCDLYALKCFSNSQLEETLIHLYKQNSSLTLQNRSTGKILADKVPLDLVKLSSHEKLTTQLTLDFSATEGFKQPKLILHFSNPTDSQTMEINLNGTQALLNQNVTTPFFGELPWAVDIHMTPLLALIEDEHRDIHLIAFDKHGQVWNQLFKNGQLDSLLAYDDGYGGYAVQTTLPFNEIEPARSDKEKALNYQLTLQLRQALSEGIELSPPLQLWHNTCQKLKLDSVETLLAFLVEWNYTNTWISPQVFPLNEELATILRGFEWEQIPLKERQASLWSVTFFRQIEPALLQGQDLLQILKDKQWPLLSLLVENAQANDEAPRPSTSTLLTLLTQQLFSAANLYSAQDIEPKSSSWLVPKTTEERASLFSAYLRAYNIHLSTIIPKVQAPEEMNDLLETYFAATTGEERKKTPLIIETSVIPQQQTMMAHAKMEEHLPLIKLYTRKDKLAQSTMLSYDRYGTGLKWPILNGEYLIRFQPNFIAIPYRLRLRNARQINYPNSTQPYSFESDLLITDLRTGQIMEKTISMNNVHETWDGYRFYLASMNPSEEGAVKRIQVVVNHDPAKYWLTYPGAIILTCGIILLFSMRSRKRL